MDLRLPPKEYAVLCRAILERDHYKCRSCGLRSNLCVHHIVFRSQQGEDTKENLVTLCASCHRGCHEEQGITILGTDANAELKFLRRNGWQPH
jgi:5-methylcytosine-specific restriction endonuclease McrA